MPKKIFEEENDSDVDFKIKTDNEYAKNYDNWRKKEELNKLKTKYGEENLKLLEDGDSSSSSDDDEEGEQLTEEIEKQFFKTLSYLKNKDPRIYDENVRFFDRVEPVENKNQKKKKEKPLYISDYERELILKKNGELSDSDQEEDTRAQSPTYIEEQKKLKESFKSALDKIEEDDGDEWGGMLKVRQKTEEEKIKEEVDYKEWLAGQKEEINDKETESELKPLKDYWNNPNLDDGEKFLRDYILSKRFLNNEDENYIPTYEEVIHDSDKDLSEDEENINRQEEFEHKYNFRFEEPDQEFIKRYPRTMEHSLRKTDDRRKLKRAETKERKQKEKEQKMQELKQLQELKRKEIEEKIEKLKEITGNDNIGFKDEDLDGDFDPEAHDRRMQNLFNDEFYQGPEDDQKPEFPELDEYLELENWEKWKGEENDGNYEEANEEYAPHCEDEDFNMDCDYDPKTTIREELIENTKGKKKRKRKSLFAKAVSQPKPVFDPKDKTYEEYLDEYYKFDCEDIIGDIPCRFKYRKVVPNSFGLTIEEILKASDRELNRWCSLKKAVQHRPDHIEKYDQIAYSKKAQNLALKKKILPSLFEDEQSDKSDAQNQDKKKKNSKRKFNDDQQQNGEEDLEVKDNIKSEETEVTAEKLTENIPTVKKKKTLKTNLNNHNEIDNEQKAKESENNTTNNTIHDAGSKDEKMNKSDTTTNKKKKKKKKKGIQVNNENQGSSEEKNTNKINTTNSKRKKNKADENNAHANNTENVNEIKNGKNIITPKKKKNKTNINVSENSDEKLGKKRKHSMEVNTDVNPRKKAKNRNHSDNKQKIGISDARLSAYGINPKKFKNKLKFNKNKN